MGPTRTSLCAALAALLAAAPAAAQRVSLVARAGGGGSSPGVIAIRACPTDTWTFRAASGDATRTDAPEVWLARGATCSFDPASADCVQATSVVPTRDASCDAGVCWTFTIPGARLVDPRTGSCATRGSGSTAVLVRFGSVAAAFPDGRIGWDTAPPAAPVSVSVSAPGESTLLVSWTYPGVTADAGADAAADVADADVTDADVVDAVDATDVADAADASDADDVADVADASVAPAPESLRRYWLLCEAADGVDAGAGACPSGGFTGLDVDDDAMLARYASQCGRGSDAIASTTTSVTLANLPEGRPYRFAVVAEDLAGNRSTATRATSCASSERITDFWERYRADTGAAEPGCTATPRRSPGAWLAVVALVLVAARFSAKGGRGRRR